MKTLTPYETNATPYEPSARVRTKLCKECLNWVGVKGAKRGWKLCSATGTWKKITDGCARGGVKRYDN